MKNLYILAFTMLLCCTGAYAQDADYVKKENSRITKAREVENDIEKYITKNLKKYTLASDKERKIKESFVEEARFHGEVISDQEIQDALTDVKKGELRSLYFKNNPEKITLMEATPIVYTVPADCNNGDFEQGLAGYTFRRRTALDFNVVNCQINTLTDNTFIPFTPSTNNFNTEGGTLITQPGSDPSLLPFNVAVPTTHSGSNAIKLNRSTGGYDITSMRSNIRPSTNEVGFHYSLIVENPHPTMPQDQPFFTVRILRGNDIVSTNNICITADSANSIFDWNTPNNPSILYTNWQCDRVTIPEEMVGLDLTLEFVITDCGQGGHFGTVYIDDICDTCLHPTFGSINLDPEGQNCPTAPFSVCGVITMPSENTGNPQSVTLNIVDETTGQVVHSYTNAVITSISESDRRFCFTVDPSIYSPADYTFVAIANFGTHQVTDVGATNSIDFSFNSNATVLNSYVIRGDLFWPPSAPATSYDLEFSVDSVCCPNSTVIDPLPGYYATTVTDNHINLYSVAAMLNYECFRWRIRTSCGWSEWCCLTTYYGYDFPPNAYWGNPYEPACYDGDINLCQPFLYEADPVAANGSQFEQREQYITAVNTINNNALVTYEAGNYVDLLPNFIAAKTSVFTARIEDCVPQTVFSKVTTKSKDGDLEMMVVRQSEQPDNGFRVYPNPTDGLVAVASQNQVKVFVVTDVTGKEVIRVNAQEGETPINLSQLSAGVYMLTADGQPIQKIIKN